MLVEVNIQYFYQSFHRSIFQFVLGKPSFKISTIQINTKQIAELYFEAAAAAAAVTPDPEVEVGSPKVTVLELVQVTDGFGSWCGIYGSTVRQRGI